MAASASSTPLSFQNRPNKIFKRVILFSIVERSINYVFELKNLPFVYVECLLYVKCADIFRVGKGEFFARRYFPRDEFSMGEGSSLRGEEVEVSWEILHWGAFQNSWTKSFLVVLLSLYRLNFTCGHVKGNSQR